MLARRQTAVVIIAWLLFGIVSAVVASNKGRSGCGWFLLGHSFSDPLALSYHSSFQRIRKQSNNRP